MATAIVSGVIGVALVWLALRALRRGTLTLPGAEGQTFARGEKTYWLLVVALFSAGVFAVVSAAAALQASLDPDPGQMRTVEGPGFRIEVPATWEAAGLDPQMEAMMFGHPRGELVVLFPAAGKAPAAGLEAFAQGARDAALRYREWNADLRGDRLAIRMRYPSPRGEVVGRMLAIIEAGKLRSVHASCTSHGEDNAALCERIVASLALR